MAKIFDVSAALKILEDKGATELEAAENEIVDAIWDYIRCPSKLPKNGTLGELKKTIEAAKNHAALSIRKIEAAYKFEHESEVYCFVPDWLAGLSEKLRDVEDFSAKLLENFPNKRGKNPDWAFYNLLKTTCAIYERHTGIKVSTNDPNSSHSAKATIYQKFAWIIFNAAGYDVDRADFPRKIHELKPAKNFSSIN